MDSWQARSGWQIAEVQQLTGLPRRDIQRACYEGTGGTGLVHPQESSWGKRSYDENDLAQVQAALQGALHTVAPGGCAETLSRGAFALLLEAPGMELSLELRLGPGGFSFLTEALHADGEQVPGE